MIATHLWSLAQARKGNTTEVFYTMPQYEAWKQKPGSASWKVWSCYPVKCSAQGEETVTCDIQ